MLESRNHISISLISSISVSFMLMLVIGCSNQTHSPTQAGLKIAVSIPPHAYCVERIGGEHVSVITLLKPGQSPHTYEPTPQQILNVANCALFFTSGVPLEKPILAKLEETSPNLTITPLSNLGTHRHNHDNHSHSQEEQDTHTWLSPTELVKQVGLITNTLIEADPTNKVIYQKNCTQFFSELTEIHNHLSKQLAPYRGMKFYVFHPAFGHFGETYGIQQVSIEVEGKQPSAKQIEALIHQARAENVRLLFTQPQFDTTGAEAIARAINGKIISLDPMAKNILQNYQTIAQAIDSALNTTEND